MQFNVPHLLHLELETYRVCSIGIVKQVLDLELDSGGERVTQTPDEVYYNDLFKRMKQPTRHETLFHDKQLQQCVHHKL